MQQSPTNFVNFYLFIIIDIRMKASDGKITKINVIPNNKPELEL